jgi:vitamin B12 transporter
MKNLTLVRRDLFVAASLFAVVLGDSVAIAVPPPIGSPEGTPAPAAIPSGTTLPFGEVPVAATSSTSGTSKSASDEKTKSTAAKSTSAKAANAEPAATTSSTTTPPNVTGIQPIIVTAATRTAQPVDTTATSTTVITHDQIGDQQYARVDDALASVPGLAVVTSGAPGQVTSVFTRGTNSDQTLLTIDGRRQAPDFSNFYDFTNLTFDNIEQVEVVRTPASSLQGGNAIGGVINLVTQSGKGVAPEGSVAFEGGSFQTYRGIADSRGQIDDFDYSVGFSRQDSTFPRPDDAYHDNTYRGNFGYQIEPNIYVDLQSSYVAWRTGDPSEETFPDSTASLFRETWNLSPRLTANVTDFWTTTVYYNRTQQRQVADDPEEFSHDRSQVDYDAADWQNDLQIAHNWKITAGIQYDNDHAWDYDNIANRRDIAANISSIGGYVQSQWQPVTGLNVISSGRYDDYSNFNGAFSWRQGVAYTTPVTATVLHASVSQAYVTPTIDDLYSPGFFGFGVGNPNLKPETDLGWEIGADQPFLDNRLTASATYFHNDLRNLIEDAGSSFDPVNIGHATTEGVELGLTAKPIDPLTLNLNYTYLDARDDVTDMRLLRRPHDSFNFTASWKPIAPLTIGLGGSWVAARVDADEETGLPVNAPDYFVMRGSVTYQVNPNVSVWVRGENITNVSYQPALGFPALGAGGYGGVKFTFW